MLLMAFQKKFGGGGRVCGWGELYPFLFWIFGIFLTLQSPLTWTKQKNSEHHLQAWHDNEIEYTLMSHVHQSDCQMIINSTLIYTYLSDYQTYINHTIIFNINQTDCRMYINETVRFT